MNRSTCIRELWTEPDSGKRWIGDGDGDGGHEPAMHRTVGIADVAQRRGLVGDRLGVLGGDR